MIPAIPYCFALAYARSGLPGWGKVLLATGVAGPRSTNRWNGAPTRACRGKFHGQRLRLDLANPNERIVFFTARFAEDMPVELAIHAALRPGDTFIDVGANIGLTTAHGAARVGPIGRVFSFEPNPHIFARLKSIIDENQLTQVTLHQAGLADTPGTLQLRLIPGHSVTATLAPPNANEAAEFTEVHNVPVTTGDAILPSTLSGPTLLKIDVEGFEFPVLRGLEKTIQRTQPVILIEARAELLQRANTTLTQLTQWFTDHGYVGYRMDTHRKFLTHKLTLTPIAGPQDIQGYNLLWLTPNTKIAARFTPYIKP